MQKKHKIIVVIILVFLILPFICIFSSSKYAPWNTAGRSNLNFQQINTQDYKYFVYELNSSKDKVAYLGFYNDLSGDSNSDEMLYEIVLYDPENNESKVILNDKVLVNKIHEFNYEIIADNSDNFYVLIKDTNETLIYKIDSQTEKYERIQTNSFEDNQDKFNAAFSATSNRVYLEFPSGTLANIMILDDEYWDFYSYKEFGTYNQYLENLLSYSYSLDFDYLENPLYTKTDSEDNLPEYSFSDSVSLSFHKHSIGFSCLVYLDQHTSTATLSIEDETNKIDDNVLNDLLFPGLSCSALVYKYIPTSGFVQTDDDSIYLSFNHNLYRFEN